MKRLIDDASRMIDIQNELGVTVKSGSLSFDNIINAISVMQKSLGITGTTALEASTTIQGSINALKGSWTNLMVGLADDTQNFDGLLLNFVNSISTVADNIKPRIITIFATIPTAIQKLVPQLTSLVKDLLPSLLQSTISLVTSIIRELPSLIKTVADTLWNILKDTFGNIDVTAITSFMDNIGEGIKKKIPVLLDTVLPMLLQFSQKFLENVPMLIESGMELIGNIIQGLVDSLPQLIEYVPQIITNIADTISNSMEIILGKGIEIIWAIIKGIIEAIPDLIANIGNIIEAIFSVWQAIQWVDLGKNLIDGLLKGIKNLWSNFTKFIDDIFNNIFETIKNIFTKTSSESSTIWGNIFGTIKSIVGNIFNVIKSVFTNAFDTVKTIFNKIFNAIKNPIETARDIVKNAIDKMKSFFNFTWTLPKLKMPHVKIEGEFSLLPPKVPKFSIDWYKEGGILKQPTIFGFNPFKNSAMVGGEAGAEAIAPISELQGYVRSAVREQNMTIEDVLYSILELLSDYLPQLQSRKLVLDSGALVGELSSPIDYELGVIKRRKDRQ